jgi:hypothetical protein
MIETNFVEQIIRRSNRKLLRISVVVLVILGGLEALSARYFINFFTGPSDISAETLLNLSDPETLQNYYVNVTGEDSFDTGYQYVTEDSRGNIKSVDNSYVELGLGNKQLLVKLSGDLPEKLDTQFTGALMSIPSDVQREVINTLERQSSRYDFLPYMLDATDFKSPGYAGLVVGGIVFAFCLWGLINAVVRGADINKHPIMRSLARFGEPKMIADQINMEMAMAQKAGNVDLTRHWLVNAGNASLEATRLEEVVWIYKKITQHRTNGIPTGKTFTALVWDRHGKCITINGKENVIDETLDAIAGKVPWAIIGYDDQLEKAWRKDRQNMIGAVEQRRRQLAVA